MCSKGYLLLTLFIAIQGPLSLAASNFPLVEFEDYPPDIHPETSKSYSTTLGLAPCRNDSSGVDEELFYNWVVPYYSNGAGLEGYEALSLTSSIVLDNLTLVTFETRYNYSLLITTPNITDELIHNTIGNYEHVKRGITGSTTCQHPYSFAIEEKQASQFEQQFGLTILEDTFNTSSLEDGSGGSITEDYFFPTTSEHFQFSGSKLCDKNTIDCNSAYTTCNETLNGVNIFCVSTCKFGLCLNDGKCNHQDRDSMPVCKCPSSSTTWYVGERCQTLVQQWMFILYLVLTCLVFIVVCCLLVAVFMIRRKKPPLKEFPQIDESSYSVPLQTIRHSPTPVVRKHSYSSTTSSEIYERPTRRRRRRQKRPRTSYHSSLHTRKYNTRVKTPVKIKIEKPVRKTSNATKVYLAFNSVDEQEKYTTDKSSTKIKYVDKPVNKSSKWQSYSGAKLPREKTALPPNNKPPSPPIQWLPVKNLYGNSSFQSSSEHPGSNAVTTDGKNASSLIRWFPAKEKSQTPDYMIKHNEARHSTWKRPVERKSGNLHETSHLGDTNV